MTEETAHNLFDVAAEVELDESGCEIKPFKLGCESNSWNDRICKKKSRISTYGARKSRNKHTMLGNLTFREIAGKRKGVLTNLNVTPRRIEGINLNSKLSCLLGNSAEIKSTKSDISKNKLKTIDPRMFVGKTIKLLSNTPQCITIKFVQNQSLQKLESHKALFKFKEVKIKSEIVSNKSNKSQRNSLYKEPADTESKDDFSFAGEARTIPNVSKVLETPTEQIKTLIKSPKKIKLRANCEQNSQLKRIDRLEENASSTQLNRENIESNHGCDLKGNTNLESLTSMFSLAKRTESKQISNKSSKYGSQRNHYPNNQSELQQLANTSIAPSEQHGYNSLMYLSEIASEVLSADSDEHCNFMATGYKEDARKGTHDLVKGASDSNTKELFSDFTKAPVTQVENSDDLVAEKFVDLNKHSQIQTVSEKDFNSLQDTLGTPKLSSCNRNISPGELNSNKNTSEAKTKLMRNEIPYNGKMDVMEKVEKSKERPTKSQNDNSKKLETSGCDQGKCNTECSEIKYPIEGFLEKHIGVGKFDNRALSIKETKQSNSNCDEISVVKQIYATSSTNITSLAQKNKNLSNQKQIKATLLSKTSENIQNKIITPKSKSKVSKTTQESAVVTKASTVKGKLRLKNLEESKNKITENKLTLTCTEPKIADLVKTQKVDVSMTMKTTNLPKSSRNEDNSVILTKEKTRNVVCQKIKLSITNKNVCLRTTSSDPRFEEKDNSVTLNSPFSSRHVSCADVDLLLNTDIPFIKPCTVLLKRINDSINGIKVTQDNVMMTGKCDLDMGPTDFSEILEDVYASTKFVTGDSYPANEFKCETENSKLKAKKIYSVKELTQSSDKVNNHNISSLNLKGVERKNKRVFKHTEEDTSDFNQIVKKRKCNNVIHYKQLNNDQNNFKNKQIPSQYKYTYKKIKSPNSSGRDQLIKTSCKINGIANTSENNYVNFDSESLNKTQKGAEYSISNCTGNQGLQISETDANMSESIKTKKNVGNVKRDNKYQKTKNIRSRLDPGVKKGDWSNNILRNTDSPNVKHEYALENATVCILNKKDTENSVLCNSTRNKDKQPKKVSEHVDISVKIKNNKIVNKLLRENESQKVKKLSSRPNPIVKKRGRPRKILENAKENDLGGGYKETHKSDHNNSVHQSPNFKLECALEDKYCPTFKTRGRPRKTQFVTEGRYALNSSNSMKELDLEIDLKMSNKGNLFNKDTSTVEEKIRGNKQENSNTICSSTIANALNETDMKINKEKALGRSNLWDMSFDKRRITRSQSCTNMNNISYGRERLGSSQSLSSIAVISQNENKNLAKIPQTNIKINSSSNHTKPVEQRESFSATNTSGFLKGILKKVTFLENQCNSLNLPEEEKSHNVTNLCENQKKRTLSAETSKTLKKKQSNRAVIHRKFSSNVERKLESFTNSNKNPLKKSRMNSVSIVTKVKSNKIHNFKDKKRNSSNKNSTLAEPEVLKPINNHGDEDAEIVYIHPLFTNSNNNTPTVGIPDKTQVNQVPFPNYIQLPYTLIGNPTNFNNQSNFSNFPEQLLPNNYQLNESSSLGVYVLKNQEHVYQNCQGYPPLVHQTQGQPLIKYNSQPNQTGLVDECVSTSLGPSSNLNRQEINTVQLNSSKKQCSTDPAVTTKDELHFIDLENSTKQTCVGTKTIKRSKDRALKKFSQLNQACFPDKFDNGICNENLKGQAEILSSHAVPISQDLSTLCESQNVKNLKAPKPSFASVTGSDIIKRQCITGISDSFKSSVSLKKLLKAMNYLKSVQKSTEIIIVKDSKK
ncbi:hypothetical protein J6590_020947 [Homalodisca vitripennis]|nr:hypothetical protein J6590_094900 [Homalodisca vitripennis]KAG8293339.1 hypothetical protein J6590_020947 [Homalodisca vitripennis]